MATSKRKTEDPTVQDFKELSISDLCSGYTEQDNGDCTCIFCGEHFQDGVIYQSRGRSVTAKRAMQEHVEDIHAGAFWSLLGLEKMLCGLTDVQKTLLACLYERKSTEQTSEIMDISAATVRTHRFNLQKAKREAKILLAMLEIIEKGDEPLPKPQEPKEQSRPITITNPQFSLNDLHPFFTQFRYK